MPEKEMLKISVEEFSKQDNMKKRIAKAKKFDIIKVPVRRRLCHD